MASGNPLLTVVISARAASDLEEIYGYNAQHKSIAVADDWETFLTTQIASLGTNYGDGKPVESRPELRYLLMKRRGRWKDGHLAVYRIDGITGTVRVLHVFHTKQDWEGRL